METSVKSVKSDSRSYVNNYSASRQKDASVKGYNKVLKWDLLEATGRCGGWIKAPTRHKDVVEWWC